MVLKLLPFVRLIVIFIQENYILIFCGKFQGTFWKETIDEPGGNGNFIVIYRLKFIMGGIRLVCLNPRIIPLLDGKGIQDIIKFFFIPG